MTVKERLHEMIEMASEEEAMDLLAIIEEDRRDLEDSQMAMEEMERNGEEPIPWERAKKELGFK